MRDSLVDEAGHPAECDEDCPRDGDNHGWGFPFYRLGAEAQRDEPADEGVEESDVEDFEEEID